MQNSDEFKLMSLYPASIQELDSIHWSPFAVILRATQWLTGAGAKRILDIGSGSGKFCLRASYLRPEALFYGVEQRKSLVKQANRVKRLLDRTNVHFIHTDFTRLDLKAFDSFYFYNSFFENLPGTQKIDDKLDYSSELYLYYSQYLSRQLQGLNSGTRLATYCSWDDEIPEGYALAETDLEGLLKFWIKV